MCAFPTCQLPLVQEDTFVGDICHIEASNPGGARYNPAQSDEERQAFDNLIIMCKNHHKVIDDDPKSYTVDRLRGLKREHEEKYSDGKELSNDVVKTMIQAITNSAIYKADKSRDIVIKVGNDEYPIEKVYAEEDLSVDRVSGNFLIGDLLSSEEKRILMNKIPYPEPFDIVFKNKNKIYINCHVRERHGHEERYNFAGRIRDL